MKKCIYAIGLIIGFSCALQAINIEPLQESIIEGWNMTESKSPIDPYVSKQDWYKVLYLARLKDFKNEKEFVQWLTSTERPWYAFVQKQKKEERSGSWWPW